MKVDLSRYFDESDVYFEFTGQLDESKISFKNRGIKFDKPIDYRVEVFTLEDGSREINIIVEYSYEEPCNRCLNPSVNNVETTLSGKLIEGKEEDYEDYESEEDEIEYLIFYENNRLDILHYVETQVYLSLPMQTLCSDDCKGLCSTCGNNFNTGDCDCEQDDIDPRLAKLKDFFPKD